MWFPRRVPISASSIITSTNPSSDPLIMHQTVLACKKHNIAIGAHPGLPDIQGFGRREIKMSPEELTAAVRYQVGALKAFLDAEDVPLHHVKPHGVLYGMMYRDKEVCRAVYAGVPKGTTVFGLAGTLHEEVAKELGLPFIAEMYGDVKYNKDKTLVIDRKKKYALPRVPYCVANWIQAVVSRGNKEACPEPGRECNCHCCHRRGAATPNRRSRSLVMLPLGLAWCCGYRKGRA
jgi:lactam utilization protein B